MYLKKIMFLVFVIVLASCTNDKQVDLEAVTCVDVFTYTDCVKTIIDQNCIICHNSSVDAVGPFPLETYEQVKDKIENGNILDRIQRPDGADGIMPQTGKMPQGKIDAILTWVNQGFLE